ncbi:hypothetical protein Trco_005579 [Trichoderma cornu-damae]|uniref:Uncharacterized protein n=1 Tax=Trichoderma cornu-damae TaxID=654480 RepID=A0A9P8TSQ4_9HYPO|nr:hypothetical protein Trco_005579 [Trichoderma cornu-damae]
MSQILEMAPGYISLEVVFGRLYIKQMAPSMVKHGGSGPTFSIAEGVEFLNGPNFRQGCVGFSPILSTLGGDANLLVSITPPGENSWRLFEKETWYDIECKFAGPKGDCFIIELNAESFQYRCRGPHHEIFTIYMHNPQRAWDMKACGVRSAALGTDLRFKYITKSLVDEVEISSDGKGDVTIKFPQETGLRADIQTISMRQVARYHQKKQGGDSVLSYFEASITSSRLPRYFDENINFECGDKATWDVSRLESEGIFEDILRPAFGMITHMDPIGSSNSAIRGIDDQDAFHEALVEPDANKKKPVFW